MDGGREAGVGGREREGGWVDGWCVRGWRICRWMGGRVTGQVFVYHLVYVIEYTTTARRQRKTTLVIR